MNKNNRYDVIIIGGGWGGLMAGITAAKRGKKTLLLEKHATVGGLAAGFTRKGYYFDAGMSRCMDYIRRPLKEAGIDVVLKPHRTVVNIAGCWVDYTNLEAFFQDLGKAFPEEQPGLQMLYEKEVRPVERMMAAVFGGMNQEGLIHKMGGMLRLVQAIRTMRKTKSLQEMEGDIFARYLKPDGRAYRLLIEREDEVDYRGEMDFMTKVGKLYTQTQNFYPHQGFQELADQMVTVIRTHHGEVRTSASVEKILIEGGRAIGVAVKTREGSETIYAHNIISCIDLNKTFHHLVGDACLDAAFLKRLGESKLSRAIPILYLGVRIAPEKVKQTFQGRDEVWFFPEADPNPDGAHFFRDHSMVVHASCLHDPDHAPAGKTNLQIYLSCPPDGWMDHWGLVNEMRCDRYREIKEMVIADVVNNLERLLPDLKDRSLIEVCELGTPYTLERYTGNTHGSCLGFRMDADFIHSKKMGTYFDRCPGIAHLYLAGQQSGYPGGALIALESGRHAGKFV